ncbi:MAG TPA: proline--tRNA ligase [Phycisphaerae bacterium]|nr:proline--tRNA ligase [Phycisphaerae bacterium]HOI54402.1 proline--tRNA ligase [Phycisphaerae bacterium]
MRWTQSLIPTLKEVPSEAELVSHRLMIRAGLIRKLTAGAYTYLPLGYRILRKAEQIVREEMDRAGALELHMPVLQPQELWEESGRMANFGPDLMIFKDRHGKTNILGPTHEEVVTDVVRNFISSYKQLPVTLYQIQTKFRDEIRPRFGVLRSREFLMKDAYSFDCDVAGLEKSYQKQYDAYCRIFSRCGLRYVVVEAESGPIGGSASSEFMVPCDAGEDELVQCPQCGYAANMEKATAQPLPAPAEKPPLADLKTVATPDQRTIDEVTAFLGLSADRMIKTLVYVDGAGKPFVVCVRGDHDVNEMKLAHVVGAGAQLADERTILEVTGAPVGFAGPVGLKQKVPVYLDQAVSVMVNAASGANQADAHVTGVNPGRDFPLDRVHDLRFVVPGDLCPRCSAAIAICRGIEIGHVFKLGTKYSQAMGATYQDEAGASHTMIMGCYGIGVNRIVASAVEILADEQGLVWPMTLAPYHVLLVPLRVDGEEMAAAEKLYRELQAAGVEVLLDDRDARAGVKFNDADLIGVPLRVTIGGRGLKEGSLEVRDRASGETVKVPVADVAAHLTAEVRSRLAALNKD